MFTEWKRGDYQKSYEMYNLFIVNLQYISSTQKFDIFT